MAIHVTNSPTTTVLITGISRGIGQATAATYLTRPNHVVIGSVRDAKSAKNAQLKQLPTANGSKLVLVSIENASHTDAKSAAEEVKAAGIDHIDIVISNSGVSPDAVPLSALDPKILVDTFNVNSVSTITLYQAFHELLLKSSNPKWITVSSRAGSVGFAADFYYYVSSYGISKAAQNWFTSTLHVTHKELTVFAVHPGFVATDMGNAASKSGGFAPPPTTPEECATKMVETIDSATRESISGKLIDSMTGETIPW